MQLLQIVSTTLFLAWMFAVVYLLANHAINSGKRSLRVQTALADATTKSAQAAHEAAEAALKLAELLEKKYAP